VNLRKGKKARYKLQLQKILRSTDLHWFTNHGSGS